MWQPPECHRWLGPQVLAMRQENLRTDSKPSGWVITLSGLSKALETVAELQHGHRRKERPRWERERGEQRTWEAKKDGQEGEKRGSPGGEKGGKNPGKCLQRPSGTVPRSEWASPQPSPSDSRRVSAFFFFLIKTSRFIIQLINQEVLMSIQQLMISVKMKLEIHYISAQGNFPMYSKTYTAVFVLIWFLNNNSLCLIHHLVSL